VEIDRKDFISGDDIEGIAARIDELKALTDIVETNAACLFGHAVVAKVAVGAVEVKLLPLDSDTDVNERWFAVRDAVFEGISDEWNENQGWYADIEAWGIVFRLGVGEGY